MSIVPSAANRAGAREWTSSARSGPPAPGSPATRSSQARASTPGVRCHERATYEVVGLGLISSTVTLPEPSSSRKSTPTNPRSPGTDSTARRGEGSGQSPGGGQLAPSIGEPPLADLDPLPSRPDRPGPAVGADEEARAHRHAGDEGLEQGLARGPGRIGECPGIGDEIGLQRPGAVDRLEDRRIGEIARQSERGDDTSTGRGGDPPFDQVGAEPELVAGQFDRRGGRAERAAAGPFDRPGAFGQDSAGLGGDERGKIGLCRERGEPGRLLARTDPDDRPRAGLVGLALVERHDHADMGQAREVRRRSTVASRVPRRPTRRARGEPASPPPVTHSWTRT